MRQEVVESPEEPISNSLEREIALHDAKLAELRKQHLEILAAERPNAINQVQALIARYNLSRLECESPSWPTPKQRKPRSDVGKPRGPGKAAAPAVPTAPSPLAMPGPSSVRSEDTAIRDAGARVAA